MGGADWEEVAARDHGEPNESPEISVGFEGGGVRSASVEGSLSSGESSSKSESRGEVSSRGIALAVSRTEHVGWLEGDVTDWGAAAALQTAPPALQEKSAGIQCLGLSWRLADIPSVDICTHSSSVWSKA